MMRSRFVHAVRRRTEQGFTLITVLIVLVAMMMAGVSLMNSMNTATLVVGNMAFRQAATHAGDIGTEAAIAWLQSVGSTGLYNSLPASGYFALQADPDQASGETWDDFWKTTLDKTPAQRPVTATKVNSNNVITLKTDTTTGTTVSYVIHRLCAAAGSPTKTGTNCASSPLSSAKDGDSHDAGTVKIKHSDQQYYRITTRIEGPRNTVSYVQTVIAL